MKEPLLASVRKIKLTGSGQIDEASAPELGITVTGRYACTKLCREIVRQFPEHSDRKFTVQDDQGNERFSASTVGWYATKTYSESDTGRGLKLVPFVDLGFLRSPEAS